MSAPKLAVIGHPNKGKSSLVAALAYDDSVRIGADPGTTKFCREFPFVVDGELLYTLVDTPGFQRARKALHWMRTQETDASKHPQVLQEFLNESTNAQTFPDEVELLRPVIAGAGVLYVVDGSVPYGSEYEAEMEILRWSGQPSMALINLIGDGKYVEEWKRALTQYFSLVRVFDVVKADFARRIELLEDFGTLRDEWQKPLERAVEVVRAEGRRKAHQAARKTSDTIAEMLSLKLSQPLGKEGRVEDVREDLEKRYRETLRAREKSLREAVERVYLQHGVVRKEDTLQGLESQDLFAAKTWSFFGLNKRDILLFGAVGGGVIGSALDIATAGSSLFLGTLVGGGVGALGSLLAANSIFEFTVLSLPLGQRAAELGPMRNLQFPHIVFNRARVHHALIANRTHASQEEVRVSEDLGDVIEELSDSQRREIERQFSKIRNGDLLIAGEKLFTCIHEIFLADVRGLKK